MAEVAEKIVEIQPPPHYQSLQEGEHVTISLKKSLGYRALFLGYLLPFLVLLTTLIITLAVTGNESLSALAAITTTVLYYYILYKNRELIKTSFRFYIKS